MPAGTATRRRTTPAPPLQVVRGQGRSTEKPKKSRREQLANMPGDQIICRVVRSNHSINPDDYHVEAVAGGGWATIFTCAVCGTEITQYRDRHGFREPTAYKRPKGYLMEEGGALTAREKADLFTRWAGGRR